MGNKPEIVDFWKNDFGWVIKRERNSFNLGIKTVSPFDYWITIRFFAFFHCIVLSKRIIDVIKIQVF